MAKKSALGKGLGALIEEAAPRHEDDVTGFIKEIAINQIQPNPYQPRKEFDEEALQELADSISALGVIQPITVNKNDDGTYTLISGERRLRAAKIAKLETIPAYIRTASGTQEMMEMALVENIQRVDLDAISIALGYQRLMDECKLTQEEMSRRIGKKRSTIANYLRLLKLPAQIQLGLKTNVISMGHARALINIDDSETQLMIYKEIVKQGFSVRKVEEIVRAYNEDKTLKLNKPKTPRENIFAQLQDKLSRYFNTKVSMTRNDKGKGKIVINFANDDELEHIIRIFDKLKH